MQTALSRLSVSMQKKEAHPLQWLTGLSGLNRLAGSEVGGQRSVLNYSRHSAADLSPCKECTWSGIAGSLSIDSA